MRRLAWIEITRAPDGESGGGDSNSGGSSGGTADAAGGGGGADNAAPAAFDWAGTLGARHADFADTLTAKGWKNPSDVLTAYRQLEQDSATRVAIPGDGATDEDRAAFWKALGRPDTAEGYGLARPENMPEAEWDNDRMGRFAEAAHALGMPAAHVKGVIDWLAQDTAQEIAAYEASLPKMREAHEAGLRDAMRKEFGAQAPAAEERARRVFQTYVGDDPEAQAAIDLLSAKAGNLAVLKIFAKIGEDVGEARLRGGGGAGAGTGEDAKAALTKLKADPEFQAAFSNSSHPQHKEMVAKHNELAGLAARARTA